VGRASQWLGQGLRDQVYHQEEEEEVDLEGGILPDLPEVGILPDLLEEDSLLDLLAVGILLDLPVGDILPALPEVGNLLGLPGEGNLLDHPAGDNLQLLAILQFLQLQGILQPRGNLRLQEIQCLLPGEIHQRLQSLLQTGGRKESFVQRAADT